MDYEGATTMTSDGRIFVIKKGRWTRFNKKNREGPNFPPKNPGGKKKTTKKRKY